MEKEKVKDMDYKTLLIKYIAWVVACEGIDYISYIDDGWYTSPLTFTDEEKAELNKLSIEVDKIT